MRLYFFERWMIGLIIGAIVTGCTSIPDRQTITPHQLCNTYQSRGYKNTMENINPIRLRQDPPDAYRLGPKDTIGLYVESVTGSATDSPPIHIPPEGTNLPPAVGYPYTIRDDGTLSLPSILGALNVEGMTLMEAEQAIRSAYVDVQRIVTPNAKISVSLIRPRTYHVVVIREDVSLDTVRDYNISQGKGNSFVGRENRGSAKTVDMWAYQNDVLNALNLTGGMPSLTAKNEVIVLRGAFAEAQGANGLLSNYSNNGSVYANGNPNIVRIQLRAVPGQPLPDLSQDDIILKDGDVVVIQSRDAEVFYTGGLLPGGMFPIPRDFDLDVFGAMSMAGGSVAVAAGGSSTVRNTGVGTIVPPTRLLVIREINGYRRAIKIDMKQGLIDKSQCIPIQPNDLILLEYTPSEVVLNMFLSTFSLRLDMSSLWD